MSKCHSINTLVKIDRILSRLH